MTGPAGNLVGGLLAAALLAPAALAVPPALDDARPAIPQRSLLLGVEPLPQDANPQEVQDYLRQIADATEALGRDPRRDDPQTELLEALAHEHLDELVQAHERHPQLRYYLDPIIHREIARRGGPDADRLGGITLAPGADDTAAWSYVTDIARATTGQRRVSATDPQVDMLQALADEHMRVLIDAVELPEIRFYALLAVRRSAINRHKDTIINALPDQPRLIGVVRQQGWTADARDALVLGMERGIDYMPRTWVQAVVELRDPATYDALAVHLVRMRGAAPYYTLMCDLPGINLDAAVALSWERVCFAPTHARELLEVSEIAVAHGHHPALDHLMSILASTIGDGTMPDESVRHVVRGHLEFAGDDAALLDWYHANRDRLRFSRDARCFYVVGELQ